MGRTRRVQRKYPPRRVDVGIGVGSQQGGEARRLDGVHEELASPANSRQTGSATGPLRGILADILGGLTVVDTGEPESGPQRSRDATAQGRPTLTEEERALRISRCIEHHLAYGIRIEDDDQRARAFLNDTACIPIEIFHSAMRVSRQTHEGNFPPTAGQVIHTARAIEWERDPGRFRNNTVGGLASPVWYQRMRAGKSPQFLSLAPGESVKEIA
jgi:hypothetical protein